MTNMNPTQSPLGAAVAERMADKKLSQRKLAAAAGMSQSTISDLISGNSGAVKLDNLQAIAGALDTTVGGLLGEVAQASPAGDAAAVLVPFNRLRASPLNPRKTFDHGDLMELAGSLHAQGMLQPVTARPDPENPGGYEVVIGGRRLRAAELLVDDGHWSEDHGIPATIRDLDDLAALAMATAENVQREDMHPLEEAEAFLELRKRGQSTAEIAATIGKTQRWVQERLRIAESLTSDCKERFLDGILSLAEARELSRGPAQVQQAVLAKVKQQKEYGYPCDAGTVRHIMTDPFPPVTAAIFDRALYDGEIIAAGDEVDEADDAGGETEGEADPEYFADVDQFHRLQEAAIAEKIETLSAKWPWVDRIDQHYWHPSHYDSGYTTDQKKGEGDPGMVVWVNPDSLAVEVYGKLWREKKATAQRRGVETTGEKAERDPIEKIGAGRRVLARNVKTRAIQSELSGNFTVALQVACTALMGANAACRIHTTHPASADQGVIAPELAAVFETMAKELNGDRKKKILRYSDGGAKIATVDGSWADNDHQIFEAVRALSDADLQVLFAALVAGSTGSFAHCGGSTTGLGDRPVAVEIASALGTATEVHWRIDEAYLATLTKADLVALGWRIGMTGRNGMPQAKPINKLEKMRTTDLRAEVLAYVEANDVRHVPPEMQILGTLAAEAGIRREAKEAPGK